MMFDRSTQTALREARAHALARSGYTDESPPDPDNEVRASIASLSTYAPSVGTASALLTAAAVRPVPLDPESTEPTAPPLTTLGDIERHYRARPMDGVGVHAGTQTNGSALFAVKGTVAALRAWLADAGTELSEITNEYGTVISSTRSYRPTSRFVSVRWAAPPAAPARSITTFGASAADAGKQLPGDKAAAASALGATAWMTWTVAPDPGKRLHVRSHSIGKGLDVVGEHGLVPWHAKRGDGTTCSATGMPIADGEPLSPWLSEAIGAVSKASK